MRKPAAGRTPDFSRLCTALYRRGEPDCVPLMEFYIHPDIKNEFLARNRITAPPEKEGTKVVERETAFWTSAGYDYVPVEISLRFHPASVCDPRVRKARESLFLDYTRREGSRGWVEAVKGLITSMEDFEQFPWPSADELDFSPLETIGRFLPDNVKVIVQPGRFFQGVWAFMGFERFCTALTDEPELVANLFSAVCGVQADLVRRALEYGCVGAVWAGDDIAHKTGLMIGPEYLRTYVYPWFKEIGGMCAEKGVPFIFHSDGDISGALEDLASCGIDAIHPIEPLAMDIVKVKERVKQTFCIIGNIDLEYTLTRGTPDEVERAVREKIMLLAPGGGFCIGSANSIPDYVPFDNYDALRRASLRFGCSPSAYRNCQPSTEVRIP